MERRAARFQIIFTVDATLDIYDLWPDDDAPENPTAEDVRALIEAGGGILQVTKDWNLADRHSEYDVIEVAAARRT